MSIIKLAISTLPDSFPDMVEHLFREYTETADEVLKWRMNDTEIATNNKSLLAELADIQFMAATISKQKSIETDGIRLGVYFPSPAIKDKYVLDIYRAWTEVSDKFIRAWGYMRKCHEPKKIQQRNIKIHCKDLIIAVEYMMGAIGLDTSARDKIRAGVYEKNRVRGYYD